MNRFMKLAMEDAEFGIEYGHGGPFGCVIVKDGEIVAVAHNSVILNQDATAHGEIMAIRKASQRLHTFDLSGCEVYTTGEPCAMCLCACMWANISKVYYACSIEDNAYIGFRDQVFDDIFSRDKVEKTYLEQIDRDEVFNNLFEKYKQMNNEKY